MLNFRKLAASSQGEHLRKYFTENTPKPSHDPVREPGKVYDPGGRLTSYYTGRDSRATWRPDLSPVIAKAAGIDPYHLPTDKALDHLFEAKRADNGEAWSDQKRSMSGFDFTFSPHKSVSLAAEFAETAAESAAIWHAIDRANDAAMHYAAERLGFARRGHGGEDGTEAGHVGWVSFRHHVARPTVELQDGKDGPTYLMDAPVVGDPQAHVHNFLMNMVVTPDGRVGSLNTKLLTSNLIHELGGYFQARLADELRRLGAEIDYDGKEEAAILTAIPSKAVETFSKRRQQVLASAKAFAKRQGLDWNELSLERKQDILNEATLISRRAKNGDKPERDIWRLQAKALGWEHKSILTDWERQPLSEAERFDQAYQHAARHLAEEFHTAAVLDHDRLRVHAVRGLIGAGIAGGTEDIDKVVKLVEQRGLVIDGAPVRLVTGSVDHKVRVTHSEQIRIEQALAEKAKAASRDPQGALSLDAIQTAVAASGLDFTSEPDHGAAQRAAIHALGQGGRLTLLTGVAGSGKTTLLQPLVAAWKADTRFSEEGRDLIGVATAWRQSDALKDAGIDKTIAMQPFLEAIDKGDITPSANTVLVIDEVSQVGPRAMLKLLELQAQTGMTIKALGDREQAQSIEAGDTIEILRRVLPKEALPELLSTVRQHTQRGREIAGLFREGKAAEALELKQDDGTAKLLGGDYDQVVDQIADLYLQRRDYLRAAGKTITVSALTNEDAASLSKAIRSRLKERGEISPDETLYKAVDQRGETYTLPIATGDRLRLFRRTWATIDGKGGSIGNNGDIVEVAGRNDEGLFLKDRNGRLGHVEWRRLMDTRSNRLLLGYGHALTVDAAQGMTSEEHINALPRGSAGITGFKAYVAESRSRGTTWTMISESAVHEAEHRSRALGDATPITPDDLWKRVAKDMADKPYKPLALDLIELKARAVEGLIRQGLKIETWAAEGRDVGGEIRRRVHGKLLDRHIAPKAEGWRKALEDNQAVIDRAREYGLAAQENRRKRHAATQSEPKPKTPQSTPSSTPSPGV